MKTACFEKKIIEEKKTKVDMNCVSIRIEYRARKIYLVDRNKTINSNDYLSHWNSFLTSQSLKFIFEQILRDN